MSVDQYIAANLPSFGRLCIIIKYQFKIVSYPLIS